MDYYVIIKWLHVLSSTLLFGTGIGSAFYLLTASLGRDPQAVAAVARNVVLADWIFTAPAIIVQPATGFIMIYLAGLPLNSKWIAWSIGLYLLAGACWLPVVWIQMKMRDLAQAAAENQSSLPPQYWRYFRIWFALGVPAFFGLTVVFYLMVAKP